MRIEVVVYRDSVIIEGQRVLRPSHIAPSQWLQMWERALPLFKNPYYEDERRWPLGQRHPV